MAERSLKNFLYELSNTKDGNMSFKLGPAELVKQNRLNFCHKLNIDIKNCATSQLEHKTKIARLSTKDGGRNMLTSNYDLMADCLITNEPNLFLFTIVADCLVITLTDPVNQTTALIHAGWKGLNLNIISKTVTYLQDNLNSQSKNITARLSPAIHSCCYAYQSVQQTADKNWQPFLNKQADGLIHIDIIGLTKHQLITAGLKLANIIDSPTCTNHDQNYFSHFRDQKQNQPDQGRFAVVAGFKN